MSIFTYLALGDSYTIGEGVPIKENFPYQTTQILRKKDWPIAAPEIIATTGWTTDELDNAINQYQLLNEYSFATLLIGVNNQYRGRSKKEYAIQFENLLQQALQKVSNQSKRICVLSIPDWSVTPFAQKSLPDDKKRPTSIIAQEIDEFNIINKKISLQYKAHYLDITPETRKASADASLLVGDGLHPSAKAYSSWAFFLAEIMHNTFKKL